MHLLQYSNAEYVMFCDQDDVWMPNKIELSMNKMNELEKNYGIDLPLLVFSDLLVVDNTLELINKSYWKFQKINPDFAYDFKKILTLNVVTGCTIMMNAASRNLCLPYSLEIMMHDHWIGANVSRYGKITYINAPTILYRQHGKNVEGAHKFGCKYVITKIINLRFILNKLRRISEFYKEISFCSLLICKIKVNIIRIWL